MTARGAAFLILQRCAASGAWASETADSVIRKQELGKKDAALASAIALGVLQNETWFDHLISAYSSTPAEKLEEKVLLILRIGVCQLVLLDRIPPSAAVNETVTLCGLFGVKRAAPLVNAVLRRVAENRTALPEVPGKGSASYLSVRYSHPLWLAERLLAEKGYDFTEALFAADNSPAQTYLQINTLRTSKEAYLQRLASAGVRFSEPPYPAGCVSVSGGAVKELPGFGEGLFYVQDRAARTAVGIMDLNSGMRVLDACAAPGGKSFAAALAMGGEGEIVSCDIHSNKLRLIETGAERLGLTCIRTVCGDAREVGEEFAGSFDAVIADVPCSGFGVLRKKPEIRRKDPESLKALSAIQLDILRSCARCLRPGGILLYSTCTILSEENEQVVNSFLDENNAFSLCPFDIGGSGTDGMYTFYPHIDGTDGFYVCKMRKR